MSSASAIPRFLLPQRSSIWRTRLSKPLTSTFSIRRASSKSSTKKGPKSSKPLVLEKPTKFNPPSHGARLRKDPPRYPGPQLSAEERARQNSRKYPNMMPPPGTFMHWFMNNRSIHMYIALSTLFTLAGIVWISNFKRNSPFADMLPHWTQLFVHPIKFTRTCVEVLRLNAAHVTAETQERRKRKVEDVQKRSAYRKAHGLEKDEGFGGWMAKTDEQLLGPGIPMGEIEGKEGENAEQHVVREKKPPVRKWLGIW